ncbi:hypothetical protein [Rhodococcus sp. I2R]|uniref:hypothetical protein n=1 Tax=Rhodococcus sp. I2R TaxID=2855445 RepID=UPI001E3ED521|nr:hypothetical protein [Rhodococcus sp. I2R]MCC8930815.1 hypothetical protein [Rhodococcus sp. I2R]
MKQTQLVVKLYSRSKIIRKAVEKFCENHDLALSVNEGDRPETASFVVTTNALNRDTVVLANTHCTPLIRCEVVHLPEADLYLAAAARYARGLTLCGSDHVVTRPPEPKPEDGVLF